MHIDVFETDRGAERIVLGFPWTVGKAVNRRSISVQPAEIPAVLFVRGMLLNQSYLAHVPRSRTAIFSHDFRLPVRRERAIVEKHEARFATRNKSKLAATRGIPSPVCQLRASL